MLPSRLSASVGSQERIVAEAHSAAGHREEVFPLCVLILLPLIQSQWTCPMPASRDVITSRPAASPPGLPMAAP